MAQMLEQLFLVGKIEALKERLKKERVINFFKSPAELQAQVIDSLSKLRQPNLLGNGFDNLFLGHLGIPSENRPFM